MAFLELGIKYDGPYKRYNKTKSVKKHFGGVDLQKIKGF